MPSLQQLLNAERSISGESFARKPRVLIVVPGSLTDRLSGPGIRFWALALALSELCDVTAAVTDPPASQRDGIRLVPSTRRHVIREVMKHDALISGCVPPYLLPIAAAAPPSSSAISTTRSTSRWRLPDSLVTRRTRRPSSPWRDCICGTRMSSYAQTPVSESGSDPGLQHSGVRLTSQR